MFLGILKEKNLNLKIRSDIFQLQFDMRKGKNRIVRKKKRLKIIKGS